MREGREREKKRINLFDLILIEICGPDGSRGGGRKWRMDGGQNGGQHMGQGRGERREERGEGRGDRVLLPYCHILCC